VLGQLIFVYYKILLSDASSILLSNTINLFLALLAPTVISLPLAGLKTAGATCSDEGHVVFANGVFQTCASGQWFTALQMADGIKCSDYGFSSPSLALNLPLS
jgi:hypothetical protein